MRTGAVRPPVPRPVDARDRQHRRHPSPHERERRRQAMPVAGKHDDDVGAARRRSRPGRPDEQHETGDEPRRRERAEHDREATEHGPTVPSAPVNGVLFTCAGQRVDIVTAFKRAGARTLATDVNPLAPALYHADTHAFVPRVKDADYVPALRELVVEHDIALIVPLTDLDHGVLARARSELGALVLLAVAGGRRRARGQVARPLPLRGAWHRLAADLAPRALPAELEFPVLVKARHGFGSRGIYRCGIGASSSSFSATRARSRWCSRAASARSSRSTCSAISTRAASTPCRGR